MKKKLLIIGIVLTFVGASVVPTTYGYNTKLIDRLDKESITIMEPQETYSSNPPEVEWYKTYQISSLQNYGFTVIQNLDGGYSISGFHGQNGYTYLLKVNSLGNQQWLFEDNHEFEMCGFHTHQMTTDGGYILSNLNEQLIKINSTGKEQWRKTVDPYVHSILSVEQVSDGGYILGVLGYKNNKAWTIIKTDEYGNIQWIRGIQNDLGSILSLGTGYQALQTNDGGYIVGGHLGTYASGDLYYSDAFLLKIDADGNEEWNNTYGELMMYEEGFTIQQTYDNGYIIVGCKKPYYDSKDSDVFVVKTDAQGNEQWNKTFGGEYTDYGFSIQQTTDGGYVLAGFYGETSEKEKGLIIKLNSEGDKEWDLLFSLLPTDISIIFYSIQQTLDEGFIVTGCYSYRDSHGPVDDIILVKLAPEDGPGFSFDVIGGLGIHLKITNNGPEKTTIANWEINIEGGTLGKINKTFNGTIDIPIGKTKIVRSGILFGLGPTTITAKVADKKKTKEGYQFIIFSMLK